MTAKRVILKPTPAQSALVEVTSLADKVADLQFAQAEAYASLVSSIKHAVRIGVPQAEVARAAGLTRQRVGQLVHGG